MDFTKLATEITIFLSPFFPYLILGGEAVSKEIGEKFGETVWEKAKSLWRKIQNPKLDGLATALAESPKDEDLQVALIKLLSRHLEKSPELADELVELVNGDRAIQRIIIEHESKAKDIYQHLSKSGTQETKVRGNSQVDNITQEM